MQTTFADAVLNITVTGALVRLELGTLTPAPGSNGKQEFATTPTQQVVLPLEGFIRAFGMQETVIKKLITDGVLKAQPAAAAAAPVTAEG